MESHTKSNATQSVTLPNVGVWEYEIYSDLHADPRNSSALHFSYTGGGARIANGQDYNAGFYCLDVFSRRFQWIGASDDHSYVHRAFNGRHIYFKGPDGPDKGGTLVSAIRGTSEDGYKDEKALHNFSTLGVFAKEAYWIEQMSPNRESVLIKRGLSDGGGSGRTYFLVDVATGKTRVLLRDTVRSAGSGFMSDVFWVTAER